ncbi:MAG: hypothetical protein DSY81_07655 [Bacillota bacterium]|nr:MAG: hypothetical protein DSY81_07655 [Bacillota bacterium]
MHDPFRVVSVESIPGTMNCARRVHRVQGQGRVKIGHPCRGKEPLDFQFPGHQWSIRVGSHLGDPATPQDDVGIFHHRAIRSGQMDTLEHECALEYLRLQRVRTPATDQQHEC